ncbi:oligosaccharyl transferase glycoprotein complex, beta subunit [Exophiala xenobiotica]|uniref:Dolichyl-diphosphooligosaccharide--protein glycosyltransferase subunit WBP1 n=1 Tax=Lithohypha guttulata TaxID=1690604 RepID=A0ABR0K1N0_9EURO|nr:oligosaccharyl transferase glycoprotein complex, beta subunit [Lithohypha guttulata]KAK5312289.1 oligosaccharyl transferase glycoprotein complex, beta subunit [Exophiala xenobiotica]
MRLFSSIWVLLWTLFTFVTAKSAVGDRVLVVLEDSAEKDLYSQFWKDLEARDFKLSFESPKAEQLSLFKLGAPAYDHVLLLPPKSKGYGPNLAPKNLLDFTNAGGNVLLALSSETATPSAISSLLLEFDISLPSDRTSHVVDHFNYDARSSADDHNVLLLPKARPLRPDVMDFFGWHGKELLAVPKAVGQTLGTSSPLINPILKAPDTSYIYNPKEEAGDEQDISATGSQIALISAMQARNSARFTVLGSLEMLQDKWFDATVQTSSGESTKTANRDFAKHLAGWAFKEVGVLKVGRVEHHQVMDATKPVANTTQVGFSDPEIYRIKTDVSFSIEISHFSGGHYVPFTVPDNDSLQLEFSMLSPFHRLPLVETSRTTNSTIFSATFKTPDQHGIFAFRVNFKRPFFTYVDERRQVTVRHFAHDEWPRSWRISAAWPWIAGLWTVIGGFVLFVVLWLYCEPPREDEKEKLKKETT